MSNLVGHGFSLTPTTPVPVQVTAVALQHLWVKDDLAGSAVRCLIVGLPCPGGQPPTFNPTGLNRIVPPATLLNTNAAGVLATPLTPASTTVGPAGTTFTTSSALPPIGAAANGTSTVVVNPFDAGVIGPGLALGGQLTNVAGAQILGPGPTLSAAGAFAFGGVLASGGGGLRRAQQEWRPISSAHGGAEGTCGGGEGPIHPCREHNRYASDPINFDIVFDPLSPAPTPPRVQGTLLDIEWLVGGEGDFDWDSTVGTFTLSAPEFAFFLDLTSPFVAAAQRGSIAFEVQAGVVTRSDATGAFTGILPGVGTSGPFTATFGPIGFDYDLSPLVPDALVDDARITIGMSGAAGVLLQPVPEPGTLALVVTGLVAVVRCRACRAGRRRTR